MTNAIPSYNTQIVAQGLARLTSQFITQPNIRAMLAVYLQPFQDLEDATWVVMQARILATATQYTLPQTNIVFDVMGDLVGQPRLGLSDASYRALIYLRIAVNRSTGRRTDWSRFAQILAPFCDDTPILYDDQAAVYFGCWNIQLPPNEVARALGRAVPNGNRGVFAYSTWPDGNDFMWGSYYDSTAGQGKWGSHYNSAVGGLLVAGAAMP